jgi:hypothetical protein
MVDAVIDPLKPSPLSLSEAELDEIEARIEAGELPPDYFQKMRAARAANVFGHDHKTDKDGKPIENGLGSEFNMTRQSVEAYRRWGVGEPDYERHLLRMERELEVSNQRRAKERAAAPNKWGR